MALIGQKVTLKLPEEGTHVIIFLYKKRSYGSSSLEQKPLKCGDKINNKLKVAINSAKSYQAAFNLLYFFFHKSWRVSISRFTASANLVVSLVSLIKATTTQSKKPIKATTAPKMAVMKQIVPPFTKNLYNSNYTIGIISSNESTTAYLTFCAMYILTTNMS
ncbi:hypothetical protein [Lactobacillus taiwanensis]|uniref:hypothetical protein n=1 Tax=Lactobacillus taiwanensis TaxID=508451 RepID=UPI00321F86D0